MSIRSAVLVAVSIASWTACGVAQAAPPPPSGIVDLAAGAELTLKAPGPGSRAGYAVAPAGDVNGDGKPDVIVGAPRTSPNGRAGAGSAFVVFWPAKDAQRLGDADLPGLRIDGASEGDDVGFSVAAAGDVNGDGLGDVIVGAPHIDELFRGGAGGAYVVYGRVAGGTVDLAALTPDEGFRIVGGAPGDFAGVAVAGPGDVNGDGVPDLVVGAPYADPGGVRGAGTAFVVFGRRPGANVDLAALGSGGYAINGPGEGAGAGLAVAGSPDVNGDQRPEVIVGAPNTKDATGTSVGGAYVVLGRDGTAPVELAAPDATVLAYHGGPDELFGLSVASAGDQDGDNRPDIVVGAPHAGTKERPLAGAAYLIPTGGAAPARISGAQSNDRLGGRVAGVGDVNGDGRPDVAVTAQFATTLGRAEAGAAYLVLGQDKLEDVDVAGGGARVIVLAGPSPSDHLYSVAGAGDLDGDKSGDLIAGAIGAGGGQVFVVRGFDPPLPPPVLPPDPGVQEEVSLDGCHAAKNIELLVDDSGSMEESDPAKLRERAIELILSKPRNVGKTIGAVEFGSQTDRLFPPQPVQPGGIGEEQVASLSKDLRRSIAADNEGTNYNAGFEVLKSENPQADVRMFLTDGAHNEGGAYANGHRGTVPTYVVGLGIGLVGPDARRLARIATETHALYFPRVTADTLQPVINAFDSITNCDLDLISFVDNLTQDSQPDPNDVTLDDGTHSIDVNTSWDDTGDVIEPAAIDVLDSAGGVIGHIGARVLRRAVQTRATEHSGGFTVRGAKGATFFSLRVNGVRGAKVRVRVHHGKLRGRRARVHTQVSQSRRRH